MLFITSIKDNISFNIHLVIVKMTSVENSIIQGDTVKSLKNLATSSVDMIFADPPYNLRLGKDLRRPDASIVEGVTDHWDQFESLEQYDEFTIAWLREARRVLKENGTIWVIGSYHNVFRLGYALQNHGFWILNDVIWRKSNPMPNFKGTRFTNAHETLIWAARSEKSRYTFNYQALKNLNEDKQMRSDWTFPICSGEERLRDVDGSKIHSTQKPEELLYRVILSSTNEGDLVLDPFLGSGTTAAVAKKLRRNWIGIEREHKYVRAAEERIASTVPLDSSLLPKPKKASASVKFGQIVESGVIPPGTRLHSRNHEWSCTVLADSSVVLDDLDPEIRGSIHKTAKHLSDNSDANGWKFWFTDWNGAVVDLDFIRKNHDKASVQALAS